VFRRCGHSRSPNPFSDGYRTVLGEYPLGNEGDDSAARFDLCDCGESQYAAEESYEKGLNLRISSRFPFLASEARGILRPIHLRVVWLKR
jgi:hypothetical protein